MIVIKDQTGKIVSRSQNQAGVRRRLGSPHWNVGGVDRVRVWKFPDGRGHLFLRFANGDSCSFGWASFAVLCSKLRTWRTLHGAPLFGPTLIPGPTGRPLVQCRWGVVAANNPFLAENSK